MQPDLPRSSFDFNFSLFGVPVRVEPMFWVLSLLLGINLEEPVLVMIWIAAVFVSILVHEFGHVYAMRLYGWSSHVVLHSFGGLAIQDTPAPRTTEAQVLISFAGPLAGFSLALGLVYLIRFAGGDVNLHYFAPLGIFPEISGFSNDKLRSFCYFLLEVNIYWGLMNLLPVLPLDGGQIARAVLMHQDRHAGLTRALWLSVFVAGAVAAYAMLQTKDFYLGLMFAYMGYTNFQAVQSMRGDRGGW
jgi:Zn-dependent protease